MIFLLTYHLSANKPLTALPLIYFIMSSFTSKYKSTPTFSFKSRFETVTSSNLKEHLPSPHQYSTSYLDISASKKTSGKFGKAIKILALNINKHNPGPGAYQSVSPPSHSSFNKKEILKHGEDRFKDDKQKVPGPNAYKVSDYNRRSIPKFTMSQTNRSITIQNSLDAPAPNIYNPKQVSHERSLSFSVGKSNRKINMLNNKNPGPGSYSSEKAFQSVSFNQKERVFPQANRLSTFETHNNAPGPGAYTKTSFIADNLKKERGFTWQKKKQAAELDTPGPGQYNSQSLRHKYRTHDGPKLAQSQRKLFVSMEAKRASSIPGPGSHEIGQEAFKHKSSKFGDFSKEQLPHFSRSHEKKMAFLNPANLNLTHKSLPKFTMSQSKRRDLYESQIKKNLPDTFYDVKLDAIKPKEGGHYKIPRADRLKAMNKSKIGPGTYNPETTDLSSRKMKFSKEKRTTFLDDVIKTKLTTFKEDTYEKREQFPNPPKYMNVYKKLQINEKKIVKF